MRCKSGLVAAVSAFVLAGCSGGSGAGGGTAASGFASTSGTQIDVNLAQEFNGIVEDNPDIGQVAYAYGIDDQAGQIEAYAGVIGTPRVGSAVASGTARYDADYEYAVVDDVRRSDGFISGQPGFETGIMTLTADFRAGTLTGNTSELRIDADIDGKRLTGDVVAKYGFGITSVSPDTNTGRVKGTLQGEIGSRGVIGAFHGNDGNTTMAGGFSGTRQ